MSSKHTPGPWIAGYNDDPCCIGTEDGEFVAMTLGCNENVADEQDYANARLIASAPALKLALENLVRPLEAGWRVSDMEERITEAHTLLSRINGETLDEGKDE